MPLYISVSTWGWGKHTAQSAISVSASILQRAELKRRRISAVFIPPPTLAVSLNKMIVWVRNSRKQTIVRWLLISFMAPESIGLANYSQPACKRKCLWTFGKSPQRDRLTDCYTRAATKPSSQHHPGDSLWSSWATVKAELELPLSPWAATLPASTRTFPRQNPLPQKLGKGKRKKSSWVTGRPHSRAGPSIRPTAVVA